MQFYKRVPQDILSSKEKKKFLLGLENEVIDFCNALGQRQAESVDYFLGDYFSLISNQKSTYTPSPASKLSPSAWGLSFSLLDLLVLLQKAYCAS